MKDKTLWNVSNSVAVLFLALIGYIWYSVDQRHAPNPSQLVDQEAAESHMRAAWQEAGLTASEMPPLIPTGVFIQSMNFNSAIDVNLTGYIWQRYPAGYEKGYFLAGTTRHTRQPILLVCESQY